MSSKHKELCDLAVTWLKRPHGRKGPGCQVAVSEPKNGYKDGEIADAIGFRAGVFDETTVLVEVKVSRADFLADRHKPYRIDPTLGMGRHRYYLAPQGILKPEDLPRGWGLVEVTPKGVLRPVCGHVLLGYAATPEERATWVFETRNYQRETSILARLLYRFGDVDALNQKYKELYADKTRLTNEVNEQSKKIRQLEGELSRYRFREKHGTPAPNWT